MTHQARFFEADPFGDAGRLAAIRMTCTIAGVPRLALGLFESGLTDAQVTRHLAVTLGARPRPAPFQRFIDHPFPGADD